MRKKVFGMILVFAVFFASNANADWHWEESFGVSNQANLDDPSKPLLTFFSEEIEGYSGSLIILEHLKRFRCFAIFFESKNGESLVFLVNFEESTISPEDLLKGVIAVATSLRDKDCFQKIFRIMNKHERKRLLIRFSQLDGESGARSEINECFGEVFTNLLNSQDKSSLIMATVHDFLNQKLTCVEYEE